MTEDTDIQGIRPDAPDEVDDHVDVPASPDEPAVEQPEGDDEAEK